MQDWVKDGSKVKGKDGKRRIENEQTLKLRRYLQTYHKVLKLWWTMEFWNNPLS
jgi:hypothetical protein